MNRDYRIVSPCLDGVLCHESVVYDGLKRPPEIARIFDRPSQNSNAAGSAASPIDLTDVERRKRIEEYFHDLYGILMKKLSQFAVESDPPEEDSVKLIAMLQELVKVKRLLGRGTIL